MGPNKYNEFPLLRILLVEDNEHDRAAFCRAFKKAQISYDYEITEFVRAEDAMAHLSFEAPQFDIVVADFKLPGMTGLEFCEELIKNDLTIPMVMLTGSGSEQAAVQAIKTGVDDYIVKDPGQGYLHLLPVVLPDVVNKFSQRIARIRAEERLYSFMDSAIDGFTLLDNDLNFMYMNPAGHKMLGLKPEDIMGKSAMDVNPLLKESGRYDAYMNVIETGEAYFAEDISLHEKFGNICISVRAFKVSGGLGIMFINITDQKLNEQRKELQLRILDTINRSTLEKESIENILSEIKEFTGFEAVAIRLREGEDFPYYITQGFPAQFVEAERYLCSRDHKGEITRDSEGNPYVECMCGNVICGRTDASKGFFTENGSFWSNNTSKLLAETTDADRQTRTRNRCNSEGYESVALFPLKVGHEILGLLQVNDMKTQQFTDDTIQFLEDIGINIGTAFARKLAKKALRESEEKYRSMMEAMKDAAYICSPEFRIDYLNPRMISRIGRDAVGELCHKAIYNSAEKCSWCVFDKIQQGEHVEYELADPQDNHYYSITNSPILQSDGLISKLTIFRDITENKAIESQLRQAHKMESIGTMAGGISHDFNNLLYMITGNAELALEDIPEWNPTHANHKAIKTAGLKAAGIVKQLLNFSRKTDQKLIPIGAVTIIKDALKFLRATIPATVEMRKHLPDKDITVMSDPVQINQLLMNLCTNASQAMEETGGILEITVENESISETSAPNYPSVAKGNYVKLTVSDTGPGIEPEIIGRIFDPYFTTKEMEKGSGMGLAVVHGIVKNHHGAITVDSKPGKGTTFTILFPVATAKPEVEAGRPDEVPLGNETILLVDDEKAITHMTAQVLKRLGYKVETELSPVKALESFKMKPNAFDLVISDMTMPQMTGTKLLRKIKAVRPDIPVIICTGHSSLIDEEKAKQLGIDAYIMKPIVKSDIAIAIRSVLNKGEEKSN